MKRTYLMGLLCLMFSLLICDLAYAAIAKHIRVFSGCPGMNCAFNSFSAFVRNKVFNFRMLEQLKSKHVLDFIALNYYCRDYSEFKGIIGKDCSHSFHKERKNQLGWNIYPQGLYEVLIKLKNFQLPVIITENGTAEIEEPYYEEYLLGHLRAMAKAYSAGVDLVGYLWWSLLDNFEWDKGFAPRFGLLDVDYKNMSRKIKPFAYTYAKIARENRIEI